MKIALLCATNRGYLFLKRMLEIIPENNFIVFSFKEDPWEPPFLEKIRNLSLSSGAQFYEAKQVGSEHFRSFWESNPIDLIFVVSWRFIIPNEIINRSSIGTFVFHDSLLPKYRGFAPTVWAIINGEKTTGVTLFKISEKVDSGDIIDQETVPINQEETIAEVMDHVTQSYLNLLEKNIAKIINETYSRIPQDESMATYTCKLNPENFIIDWKDSDERIYNMIRAVSFPYSGAYTYLNGKKLTIWAAQRNLDSEKYAGRIPGKVVKVKPGVGSIVLAGCGSILLTEVQLERGRRVCASDILRSVSQTLGYRQGNCQ